MNKSQLTRAEFFKVGMWLAQKAEVLVGLKATETQIAEMASKELKIAITGRNIRRAAKDVGVSDKLFPRGGTGNTIMGQVFKRLDTLEREVAELKKALGG